MERFFSIKEVQDSLSSMGVDPKLIGTHSFQKGGLTWTASGSTACPSSVAVSLRAGWSLAGVQNTYLRYEAAGDQYVGRTVSGLPIDWSEFAITPPFFIQQCSFLDQAIEQNFPFLPLNMRKIAEFLITSLVNHSEWLQENIPSSHRLFQTMLFKDAQLPQTLKSSVV
jgi:hypothetical protein